MMLQKKKAAPASPGPMVLVPRECLFTLAILMCDQKEKRRVALIAAQEARERCLTLVRQALLPDPHDERDVSIDWLRERLPKAIQEGR